MKISIVVIILIVILVFLVIFLLLMNTPICNGGDIISNDCGKVLFPWIKKFKLPSGKYCCKNCYLKELQTFVELRDNISDADEKEIKAQEELEKEFEKSEKQKRVHV